MRCINIGTPSYAEPHSYNVAYNLLITFCCYTVGMPRNFRKPSPQHETYTITLKIFNNHTSTMALMKIVHEPFFLSLVSNIDNNKKITYRKADYLQEKQNAHN